MKALSIALIVCTLIVCVAHYGLPFLNAQRWLALEERRQAAEERNVAFTVNLVQPVVEPRERGLRSEE